MKPKYLIEDIFLCGHGSKRDMVTTSRYILKQPIKSELLQERLNKIVAANPLLLCNYIEGEWQPRHQALKIKDKLGDADIDYRTVPMIEFCHSGDELQVRMHHLLADGISLLFIVNSLLSGKEYEYQTLELKEFSPSQKHKHLSFGQSDVPFYEKSKVSKNILVINAHLNMDGLNHNTCCENLFKTLEQYKVRKRSLWIPFNIRKKNNIGFGNGLGRVRVFDNGSSVNEQKKQALVNGELRSIPLYKKLGKLQKILLKAYFNRPGVDYASMVFSFLDQKIFPNIALTDYCEPYGGINIHPRHSMALFQYQSGSDHFLTLSYDAKMMNEDQARAFLETYIGYLCE
jgi:hypothetical protein